MEIKTSKRRKHEKELSNNLVKFNFSKCEYLDPKIYDKKCASLGVYAFDNKKIVGGMHIKFDYYNWIYGHLMWVDEKYRGKKLGTELINKVKQIAKENNCVGIRLETWDFQAKDFYIKNGFTVFGELKDHPRGHSCFYLEWKNE